MNTKQFISVTVAPVHREASFTSEMITQGLMWEALTVLDNMDNWCQVRMEDEYEGWIHQFYLSDSHTDATKFLILTNRYTPLSSKRGKDDVIIAILSFATILPLLEQTSEYCKIQLINGEEGFIPAQEDCFIKNRSAIIKLATSLIGAPYLWGGKSSFGYDCSGFVQMVLKAVDISVPRDASQQAEVGKLKQISMDKAEPGDLVFFADKNCIKHVAFMMGDGKIIHSLGEVQLESIIEGEAGFNTKLAQLDQTFISISGMINI